jgi:outer membrane protein assembly factor BamB
MFAFHKNGTQKWAFTIGNWIFSSPVVGDDGTLFFTSWDAKRYALDGGNSFMYECNPTDTCNVCATCCED